jgi:hypothetical protein
LARADREDALSTRSHIGIANPDGTVTAIYCHFDGYPDHHVPILTEAYGTEDRVRALVALGDLSSLDRELGEKHDFDKKPNGVCNAYGRDRGKQGGAARTYANLEDFLAKCSEDYTYLFKDGAWLARSWNRKTMVPADDFLAAEEQEA